MSYHPGTVSNGHMQMMVTPAVMGNFMGQGADIIYSLYTTGQDSQCGCIFCCPGESVICATSGSNFLPNELEGFVTVVELKNFTDEVRLMSSHYAYFYSV